MLESNPLNSRILVRRLAVRLASRISESTYRHVPEANTLPESEAQGSGHASAVDVLEAGPSTSGIERVEVDLRLCSFDLLEGITIGNKSELTDASRSY